MTQASKPRGRPKADPDASDARRKLLRAGLIHLTERGYTATGIDQILVAAQVPKGSFYHHFPSKAAFGLALIDSYDDYFQTLLTTCFQTADLSPVDRLRLFTDRAQAGMARHGYARGCLIGNLGQEMGALPDEFRARLIAVLEAWQQRTADLLCQAALPPGLSAEDVAVFFWTGWEGAVLRAKLERGPEPLTAFSQMFFTLITQRGAHV